MGGIREYFGNIASALTTTAKGMKVTVSHMRRDAITVQYPHERLPIPPSYRGVHILEQEKCIDCQLCAKACPVDCIEIESVHHGRVLEWQKFSIDYKKCIFCEFCIPPCPKDCIHMTSEYEMATESADDMVEDLLTWTGLRAQDQRQIEIGAAKKEGREPPEMPENGRPGGPAPGKPAPDGVSGTSLAVPGGPAAPGGEPRREKEAKEKAAKEAAAKAAEAPAAAGGGDDMAAKMAAIRAKIAKEKS
jgi:NADH-quinone oxidoreductase chain I